MDEINSFHEEVRSVWEQNAEFWDEAIGEGNQFQRILIGPAAERLLALKPGQVVLDIACGNGVFARRIAQLGAQVVACDFSAQMLERAQERSSEYAARIEYQLVDTTRRDDLLALGERRFDAAYCGMAIQDMVEIEPLFSTLPKLLKPGGRFVFSIPHPAFNNSYIRRVLEEDDTTGESIIQYAIKITGYSEPRTDKGIGIIGQPKPQYYFHRPLNSIYNLAFRHGFVLDGIEEPTFGPEDEAKHSFGWANFKGIPPVLVSRMRLCQTDE